MSGRDAQGVLISGVYGSGKSTVAAEIAWLLEQRGDWYALLDLDYLSWAGTGGEDRPGEFRRMLRNLAAVVSNYHQEGIRLFVLAYFVRDAGELQAVRQVVREAADMPLRVARLVVPLDDIQRRLSSDVTTGRLDDLREAAVAIQMADGAGLDDVVIENDRPIRLVAEEVMAFLGWL